MNIQSIKNIKLTRTHIIGIVVFAFIILAVVITLSQLRNNQQNRSSANLAPVEILFTPSSGTLKPGDTLTVQVGLNASTYNISGVDLHFKFNSTLLSILNFTPAAGTFNSPLFNTTEGSGFWRFAAVNTSNSTITGVVSLGTFTFKVLTPPNNSATTAQLLLSTSQITAVGFTTAVPFVSNAANYTISSNVLPSGPTAIVPTAGIPTVKPSTIAISPTNAPPVCSPPPCPAPGKLVVDTVNSTSTCTRYICVNGVTPIPTAVITTVQPTTKITSAPTAIPTKIPTIPPGNTTVKANIIVPSVTSSLKTHAGSVYIYNLQGQFVKSVPVVLSFGSGKFGGASGDLGSNFSTGDYIVKVKLDNSLAKQLPNVIHITNGVTTNLPDVTVTVGDINADNILSLSDYNILTSCAKNLPPAGANCSLADLNDDGHIEEIDLNVLLKAFVHREGDSLPGT